MFFAVPIMQGMATLYEAKTTYDLYEWLDIVEILTVKHENERRGYEAAKQRRRA